jgi:hypothetical protein
MVGPARHPDEKATPSIPEVAFLIGQFAVSPALMCLRMPMHGENAIRGL